MTGFFISHECRDILAYQLHIFETTQIEMTLFQRSDISRKELIESDLLLLVFNRKRPKFPFITSSKRLVKRFLNFDHIFERNDYTILPLSFNRWYTQNKISYNLAVHGSKTFLLEQDILPFDSLADAVISFALATGKKTHQFYIVDKSFKGLLFVANNTDPKKYLHVEINANGTENMVSTRQSLVTYDSVPPLHNQVLMLLTQLESNEGYKITYEYSRSFKSNQYFDFENEKNITNFPKLNRCVVGLHSARKIQN